jgi:hypothetical protein
MNLAARYGLYNKENVFLGAHPHNATGQNYSTDQLACCVARREINHKLQVKLNRLVTLIQ